jgi:ankyrin repeat protein
MISTVNKAEKKSDVTLKNNAKSEAATSAVKAKGIDGMTPIHLAVKGKHQKCVETLLQHHKPADFDVWGRAPIHLAAVAADINIAKKLLREDSRPDQVDLFGRTPLTYLKFAKDRERADDQNMAKEFMRFWKNFDTKDDNGMTVLHYAVEFLDGRDIEERYLLKGATVNTVDKLGRTPLHVAVLASREGAVKALLKHKANPSTQDLSGMTPLHAAIGADNDSISLILLENRADPGIVDANGMTPLIVAAKEGLCLKAARHIIREYPEVANKGDDDYDQPPIAWACECGEQETVELLLADKNVDPNRPARKWGNRTPLHIALMNGHTSIVSKLLNNVQVAFNWNVPKVSEGKGLESLQHALDDSGAEYFAEMLVHPKISTSTRIVALKTMVVTSRYTNDTFKRILNTVGEHDITSSELDELIRRFLRLDQNNPVLEKWMERVEDPMEWQKLACPLHILAQIGEETKLLNLVNWGANVLETDTDNWTCIDVAERNGHLDLSNRLIKLVTTDPSKNPRYARPSNFSERSDVATLSLESCSQCTTASSPCLMSQGNYPVLLCDFEGNEVNSALEIRVNDEESTFGKICLCTKESIPPDISWFYFEVQVLAIPGASRCVSRTECL